MDCKLIHTKPFDAECGGLYIGDTNSHAGAWSGFTTLATTTFTTATGNVTSLASATIPAGVTISGRFSVLKLAGGSIVAYNARVA